MEHLLSTYFVPRRLAKTQSPKIIIFPFCFVSVVEWIFGSSATCRCRYKSIHYVTYGFAFSENVSAFAPARRSEAPPRQHIHIHMHDAYAELLLMIFTCIHLHIATSLHTKLFLLLPCILSHYLSDRRLLIAILPFRFIASPLIIFAINVNNALACTFIG